MSTDSLGQLYNEVGRALHAAQMVEYEIVSIHLLLARTGQSSSKELEEEYWSRKTLGQLLQATQRHSAMPENGKQFLETLVKARNHLAHSFFFSATPLHTSEGIKELRQEIECMHSVFIRAHKFFEQLLDELCSRQGISTAAIKEEAVVTVSNLQGTNSDG